MRHLLLIYSNEKEWNSLDEASRRANVADHTAFTDEARAAGVLVHGDALGAASTTRTLRRTAEEAVLTDGPFMESKEWLGGFYLLETDADEALAWARKVPLLPGEAVEVRPAGLPHA